MSEEKRKNRPDNKITSFEIRPEDLEDPEMDAFLRESLMKEADELEERLNNDPRLRGVGVSDDLFLSIVGQLKEQGLWEADKMEDAAAVGVIEEDRSKGAPAEEKRKKIIALRGRGETERMDMEAASELAIESGMLDTVKGQLEELQLEEARIEEEEYSETAEARTVATESIQVQEVQNTGEEDQDKIYMMLSEEDRKALTLGRKMEAKKQRRVKWIQRWAKNSRKWGAVACVCVLVCGVGMTSEANRRLVMQAWNVVAANLGFRTSTNIADDSLTLRSTSKEEEDAVEKISNELGVSGIRFSYLPNGMKFLNYICEPEAWEATMFYSFEDKILSVKIIDTEKEGVSYYQLDSGAKKKEIVETIQQVKGEIWETNLEMNENEKTYVAELEFEDCRYIVNGMISLEEMKKMIKSAVFL